MDLLRLGVIIIPTQTMNALVFWWKWDPQNHHTFASNLIPPPKMDPIYIMIPVDVQMVKHLISAKPCVFSETLDGRLDGSMVLRPNGWDLGGSGPMTDVRS